MEPFKSDTEFPYVLISRGLPLARFQNRCAAVVWFKKTWSDRDVSNVKDFYILDLRTVLHPEKEEYLPRKIDEGIEIGDREWQSGPASWERFKEKYSQKGYKL